MFRVLGARWSAGGLVVAVGVEGELAEEFAGGCVDDPDVQVLEEQQDGLPGVLASDADVVEFAGVAEGDGSDGPYLVGADAVVGCRRGWLWAGRRRRWRGWSGAGGSGAAASLGLWPERAAWFPRLRSSAAVSVRLSSATGVVQAWSAACRRSAAASVDASDQLAVGRAGGVEVLVTFFELETQVCHVLFEVGDLSG